MDKPTPRDRLLHMRESIFQIGEYVEGMPLDAFERDRRTREAVLYHFMVIGEAVRHVDPEMLARYTYPWHLVRAFRNFIAHEYHAIRMERVYHAANDLGPLDELLRLILETEFSTPQEGFKP